MSRGDAKPNELDEAILSLRQERSESTRARRRTSAVPISEQVRAVAASTGEAYDALKEELERAVSEGRLVTLVDPTQIDETEFRDRDERSFQDDAFLRLKASVEQQGQIAPVTLRRSRSQDGRYEVVFGHRRVRACRALEREVKAVVIEAEDRDLVSVMLVENALREDISPVEKARYYRRLIDGAILSRTELAEMLRVSPQQISNITVLADIPDEVLEALGDWRALSIAAGKSLVSALRSVEFQVPPELLKQAASGRSDAIGRAGMVARGLKAPGTKTAATDHGFVIRDDRGRKYGVLTRSGSQLIVRFQAGLSEEIIRRIAGRIPALYEDFT